MGENQNRIVPIVIVLIILGVWFLTPIKSVLGGIFGSPTYKARSVCEIVVDRTGSTASDGVSKHFHRLASASVNACEAKGALVDIWTTGSDGINPSLVSNRPISFIYSGARLQLYVSREAQAVHQAKIALSKVFNSSSKGSQMGSDIAAALSQAASTGAKLSVRNGGIPAYVIMITDGMQLAQGTAVTSMSNIDSDPNVLAHQTQSLYPMGALKGSNVFFYGVRSGTLDSTGQPLPAWFENKVSKYWNDVVTSGGGRFCSYQNDQDSSSMLVCGGI